jgi:hypothetical protein
VGSEVHADTSLHQKGAVCYTRRGTPKDAEPGQEFRTAEWLCHKIVRAGIKRGDLVRLPVPRGENQYRRPRGTLRSIVGLDRPAGALFDRSIYEFAIHRLNQRIS